MSILITRRCMAVLVATGALLVGALAAAPLAEAGTVYACVKKNGTPRFLTAKKPKCKKGDLKLSWNIEGVAGKNGTNGSNGANGKNGTNGTNGKDGAPGQPQKAVAFNLTLKTPGFLESEAATLFNLPGSSISANLTCFNLFANFSTIEAFAPAGTLAETGMVITDSENKTGKAPEITQEPIKDVEVSPGGTPIATLSSNLKAPETNIAHLNGSLAAPKEIVLIDAFVRAAPDPAACTVRGIAFSIPR
jgi:hypothetical protein